MSRSKKCSKIAISFKAKVENDLIIEEEPVQKYLEDLYLDKVKLGWPEIPVGNPIILKLSHVHNARAKLSRNKAPGTDLMKDEFIKSKKVFNAIKHKLLDFFQTLMDGAPPPGYMRIGLVFLLSKEDTNFPNKPNIRSIMIQNMLTKMYELILQQEMQKENQRLKILSNCQRGGVSNRGVHDNLLDIFIKIEYAKV